MTDENKIDFLARYLVDFPVGKPLDCLQSEFVAKKCKNDFRKRLLDRAQIIQKRLEEEQENLKKSVPRCSGVGAHQSKAMKDNLSNIKVTLCSVYKYWNKDWLDMKCKLLKSL